jgi:hypothetical protein
MYYRATGISLYVFSAYVSIMSLVLLLVPTYVLPLFGLPVDGEVWIRLLGFVLLCSSVYYIGAAYTKFIPFARWTVYTRAAAPLVVLIFILSDLAPAEMVSFGIVDGLGALWTYLALRKDRRMIEKSARAI